MCGAREGKNIWWFLFGFWPNGKWRGRELFTRRFWKYRKYIWQDSFLTPWNRFLGCKLLGHRWIQWVEKENAKYQKHCFNCYRYIGPEETREVGERG